MSLDPTLIKNLVNVQMEFNKIDPKVFLDIREIKIVNESGVELTQEQKDFVDKSEEAYKILLAAGDKETMTKDFQSALDYAEQLEETHKELKMKNDQLNQQKKELEDDLSKEMNAKLKLKKSKLQEILCYLILGLVFVLAFTPAFAEMIGKKLSISVVTYLSNTLLQCIPLMSMVVLSVFNLKKAELSGDGKINVENYNA